MALSKQVSYDKIEVVGDYSVQCRRRDSIMENGKEISASYHRHVIHPDGDWSGEDARVQAVCDAVFTSDVKAAYEASKSE